MNSVRVVRAEEKVSVLRVLRRTLSAYLTLAANSLKLRVVHVTATWLEFLLQIINIAAFVYFWRAVYAGNSTIAGLNLQQALNYIILAQMLLPILQGFLVYYFGGLLREGQLGMELLRPMDFQGVCYTDDLTRLLFMLIQRLPVLLIAWLFFGLRLPSDWRVWLAFAISLFLGHMVIFFFEWAFACLAFYTTEIRGLYQARDGLARFLSGAFVPLVMMPGWLQTIANAFPFAQAISVPVSLLSGSTPLAEAPRVWLVQVLWLVGMALFSRMIFKLAVRKVTIQGG